MHTDVAATAKDLKTAIATRTKFRRFGLEIGFGIGSILALSTRLPNNVPAFFGSTIAISFTAGLGYVITEIPRYLDHNQRWLLG